MRNLPILAASSALLAPLAAQTTYNLQPIDSVSVDPVTNSVWRDSRLRAYTGNRTPPHDIHGLLKFDLTAIPDASTVLSMTLTCTLENAYGSPRNKPAVNLHRPATPSRSTCRPTAGRST